MNDDIAQKLKQGDIDAFEDLLSRFEKAIYGYILSMVRHKETAEDLTQETFIKVYSNLASVDPEKNLKSWIYKIATNTVYDWLRSNKRRAELFIVDDENNGFETIDEDQTYIDIEHKHDLGKALNNIKPIYKTVLMLYYYEGFGYSEIAATLDLPLNTVKTQLRRAKTALKEELNIQYG